jgi:hypothetical protein
VFYHVFVLASTLSIGTVVDMIVLYLYDFPISTRTVITMSTSDKVFDKLKFQWFGFLSKACISRQYLQCREMGCARFIGVQRIHSTMCRQLSYLGRSYTRRNPNHWNLSLSNTLPLVDIVITVLVLIGKSHRHSTIISTTVPIESLEASTNIW